MLKGIQLSLMIGPIVPIPASKVVIDHLVNIEVTVRDEGSSVFQLSFSLDKKSPLQILFLLSSGQPLLFMRVIIIVVLSGKSDVIMDGVITHHELKPGSNGSPSTLTITGEDVSALMNQQDFSGFPFPATPAEGRVALMLAKYAVLGIVPLIVPSILIDVPLPTGRIPSQRGTDLAYIKALADRVGYVFYIDSGPKPGLNVAYWGPKIKVGVPQPSLNIDMDAHTNVESISFQFDNQKNKIPTVFIYNEITKVVIPIPIPPITPLNPPLGLIPPLPTSIADLQPVRDDLSKRSIPQAIMIGLASAAQWADAVTGSGELDVLRYGRVLKARKLVGIRGAGPAFNGLYYVTSITHKIKRGEYKQSFELSRNGIISTVPKVMP
ncbi:unusual protein kinase [Candidatus Scalindua japonica]|uniref:Unusual protein kinase n=1 Tax=Candidatus Scalindua japonica TaxID=1284222 RepID=A0A286TW78_9BACT|nr:hypothetical protein [Candidatus Scalindua japonica]GAX60143.1 unusual protein kinase [Candidatus Scalindua japonica]